MPEEEISVEIEEEIEEEKEGFFSPGCLLMIFTAIVLDIAGLVEFIPVIGSVLSFVVDITGIIIIGGWIFLRSQRVEVPQRVGRKLGRRFGRILRSRGIRVAAGIVGEFIPIIGLLPLWTIIVFLECKQ